MAVRCALDAQRSARECWCCAPGGLDSASGDRDASAAQVLLYRTDDCVKGVMERQCSDSEGARTRARLGIKRGWYSRGTSSWNSGWRWYIHYQR